MLNHRAERIAIVPAAVATAVLAGFSSSAGAGLIGVNPPPGGEASHLQIIQSVYGGAFSGSPATGFTGSGASAGISVDRTDDFGLGGVRNADGSGPVTDDTVWTGMIVSVRAVARYAGYSQKFGYIPGSSGGSYVNLFNVSGSGTGVSGSATDVNLGVNFATWRWARSGDNGVHSSNPSDNADGLDHMVTYRVSGLNNGLTTWLLFFEDKNQSQNADWDYNDLAVEVTTAVPAPGAAAIATLAGAMLLGRPRRR